MHHQPIGPIAAAIAKPTMRPWTYVAKRSKASLPSPPTTLVKLDAPVGLSASTGQRPATWVGFQVRLCWSRNRHGGRKVERTSVVAVAGGTGFVGGAHKSNLE